MLFLRRWYQRNKYIIWWSIAIVGGVILILQILNQLTIRSINNKEANDKNAIVVVNQDKTIPVAGGDNLRGEKAIEVSSVISTFIDNCNNRKIEEAYNLLTDDCKQELYPTLETFKNNYVRRLFSIKKLYNIQLWMAEEGYTYRVELRNDVLSSRRNRK